MTKDLTLLGICGSLRADSFNRMLMREAARSFDPGTFVEGDLRLPLFDADLDAKDARPASVTALIDQVAAADAVVIVTPEYNQSISGVLKNALDWVSRAEGKPWFNKPVAIMSATAGRTGGARAQYALRLCMNPFRPQLLPGPEVLVAMASKQFDEDNRLVTESYLTPLAELMADLRAKAQG